MSSSWRVAIASLDGKMINEHFGRAREFFIVDLKPDTTFEFVERRPVTPLCSGGEHTQKAVAAVLNALGDCTAVLVFRIGDEAKKTLELNGISIFENPDYIEDAIVKIARYFKRTNHKYAEDK